MPGEATTDTQEVSMANDSLTNPHDDHNPTDTTCSDCGRVIYGVRVVSPYKNGRAMHGSCFFERITRELNLAAIDHDETRRRPTDIQ